LVSEFALRTLHGAFFISIFPIRLTELLLHSMNAAHTNSVQMAMSMKVVVWHVD
jgi:hypothetical protein